MNIFLDAPPFSLLSLYNLFIDSRLYPLDSHRRSIAKTLSWRLLATLITGAITLALTGRVDFAITVGLADTLVKFFIYYLHERMWSRIRFGQTRLPEYEI